MGEEVSTCAVAGYRVSASRQGKRILMVKEIVAKLEDWLYIGKWIHK